MSKKTSLASLEKKSDDNDIKHDEAINNQKAVNAYVNEKIKENAENDLAHQKAIDSFYDYQKSVASKLKTIKTISIIFSAVSIISFILSLSALIF